MTKIDMAAPSTAYTHPSKVYAAVHPAISALQSDDIHPFIYRLYLCANNPYPLLIRSDRQTLHFDTRNERAFEMMLEVYFHPLNTLPGFVNEMKLFGFQLRSRPHDIASIISFEHPMFQTGSLHCLLPCRRATPLYTSPAFQTVYLPHGVRVLENGYYRYYDYAEWKLRETVDIDAGDHLRYCASRTPLKPLLAHSPATISNNSKLAWTETFWRTCPVLFTPFLSALDEGLHQKRFQMVIGWQDINTLYVQYTGVLAAQVAPVLLSTSEQYSPPELFMALHQRLCLEGFQTCQPADTDEQRSGLRRLYTHPAYTQAVHIKRLTKKAPWQCTPYQLQGHLKIDLRAVRAAESGSADGIKMLGGITKLGWHLFSGNAFMLDLDRFLQKHPAFPSIQWSKDGLALQVCFDKSLFEELPSLNGLKSRDQILQMCAFSRNMLESGFSYDAATPTMCKSEDAANENQIRVILRHGAYNRDLIQRYDINWTACQSRKNITVNDRLQVHAANLRHAGQGSPFVDSAIQKPSSCQNMQKQDDPATPFCEASKVCSEIAKPSMHLPLLMPSMRLAETDFKPVLLDTSPQARVTENQLPKAGHSLPSLPSSLRALQTWHVLYANKPTPDNKSQTDPKRYQLINNSGSSVGEDSARHENEAIYILASLREDGL